MERALARRLVGAKAPRYVQDFLAQHLPALETPISAAAWKKRAERVRAQMLELFLRGHDARLLTEQPRVEWGETIHTGKGYRICKLRYEGYPGMWVPALLYEPTRLRGRVPAVLNPNGHHAGGKAVDYKQARCINLAKRGVLALNTEFIGMGELRADVDHNRLALLDLCGVAGIGVFYLAMKRGLDVLFAHPRTDESRVAMTGLSGGGWQTAILAALDERVRAIVPVAGHSALWQRRGCIEDIGDLEQCPTDMATVADYDVLTGLFAPRPTLLMYNRFDDCCFQTKRTRRSIYQPAKKVYELLGAAEKISLYDNEDPGTHNYEVDNRRQLYRFLNEQFGLDGPPDDLPWKEELYSEVELAVGLPTDNATLYSLAQDALRKVRAKKKASRSAAAARRDLTGLVKLPSWRSVRAVRCGATQKRTSYSVRQYKLHLDEEWALPITELAPPRARGVDLVVADAGRGSVSTVVERALAQGRRVLVADILATGELEVGWQHQMLVATAGQRALGLQVGHLLALSGWANDKFGAPRIIARGELVSVVALVACALKPALVRALETQNLIDSLARLVEWPKAYADAPSLFCFGLLEQFDIVDLIDLCAPLPVADSNGRGPLRSVR